MKGPPDLCGQLRSRRNGTGKAVNDIVVALLTRNRMFFAAAQDAWKSFGVVWTSAAAFISEPFGRVCRHTIQAGSVEKVPVSETCVGPRLHHVVER